MGRRLHIVLAALEAGLVLIVVWFEPTCVVRGTLRGEAFYQGKPISWWRQAIRHDFNSEPPSVINAILNRFLGERKRERSFPLVGANQSKVVLAELSSDSDRCVSSFATHFLQIASPQTDLERRVEWQYYLFKYAMNRHKRFD